MKKSLKIEVIEKFSTLIVSALGLVAALAWNEAILELFKTLFGERSTLVAKFLYAIIITIMVVIMTLRLTQILNKLKGNKSEKEK